MNRSRRSYINFNQLRSFFAVAQELSFTRAAEQLNIGQPTVTTQVKTLEERYNRQLLIRSPSGVSLTAEGEALVMILRQIFALEHRAHVLLSTDGKKLAGHIHIGTVGPYFVMDLLAAYSDRYPLMHVTLESGNSDHIYQRLLEYEVDTAILGSDYGDPRLDIVPLGEHEVVVILPVNHAWADRKQIAVAELDGQRMIYRECGSMTRRAFEQVIGGSGVRPSVIMELARDSMIEATAAGLGLGILSRAEFRPDERITCLSLDGEKPFTRSFVACLKERRSIASIDAFMLIANAMSLRREEPEIGSFEA